MRKQILQSFYCVPFLFFGRLSNPGLQPINLGLGFFPIYMIPLECQLCRVRQSLRAFPLRRWTITVHRFTSFSCYEIPWDKSAPFQVRAEPLCSTITAEPFAFYPVPLPSVSFLPLTGSIPLIELEEHIGFTTFRVLNNCACFRSHLWAGRNDVHLPGDCESSHGHLRTFWCRRVSLISPIPCNDPCDDSRYVLHGTLILAVRLR